MRSFTKFLHDCNSLKLHKNWSKIKINNLSIKNRENSSQIKVCKFVITNYHTSTQCLGKEMNMRNARKQIDSDNPWVIAILPVTIALKAN
jgi:hypothetical protein